MCNSFGCLNTARGTLIKEFIFYKHCCLICFFFSLSIKSSCIDKQTDHFERPTAHQMASIVWEKKYVNENELVSCPLEQGAAIMWKHRLELDSCCVNVDIDPMSITYCDQWSNPLPRSAPLPVWTFIQHQSCSPAVMSSPSGEKGKTLYADSPLTFINGQKCYQR